jgi:hypothetical protein
MPFSRWSLYEGKGREPNCEELRSNSLPKRAIIVLRASGTVSRCEVCGEGIIAETHPTITSLLTSDIR